MALSRQHKKYVDQSPYFESWRKEIWRQGEALGSEDAKVKKMAQSRQQRKKVDQLPYFLSLKLIYASQKLFRTPQKHILYALQKRTS